MGALDVPQSLPSGSVARRSARGGGRASRRGCWCRASGVRRLRLVIVGCRRLLCRRVRWVLSWCRRRSPGGPAAGSVAWVDVWLGESGERGVALLDACPGDSGYVWFAAVLARGRRSLQQSALGLS